VIAEWVAQHDPDARLDEREYLWSAALDARGGCAVLRRIAAGSRQSVEVEVQAVLWVPLIASSRRFVIAHNHPDGNLYPTGEDMALTRRIMVAAGICGLVLADHVIIGPTGEESSLLRLGLIEPEVAIAAKAAGRSR
jgi:DNA repair protein RadC